MRYAFINAHRSQHPVRVLCKMLNVHSSGFYAWLQKPLSDRAIEDKRQTGLVEQAWKDSNKVYGYRKLDDDLIDMGERVSLNRVARLARLADVHAQIGLTTPFQTYNFKTIRIPSLTQVLIVIINYQQ